MALRADTARPDLAAQTAFCRKAEELGLTGPLSTSARLAGSDRAGQRALGSARVRSSSSSRRSGSQSPAVFVQQINTLSALTDGRVSLNVVAGHSPAEQRFYGDSSTTTSAMRARGVPGDLRGILAPRQAGQLSRPLLHGGERRARLDLRVAIPAPAELLIAGGSAQARELRSLTAIAGCACPSAGGARAAARAILAAGKP